MSHGKLLCGHPVDQLIVKLPVRIDGSPDTALKLKAKAFVQADGRLVKAVNAGVYFLIPQLGKEVAQKQADRFTRIALALVFGAHRDAVPEGALPPVAAMGTDAAHQFARQVFYHEK